MPQRAGGIPPDRGTAIRKPGIAITLALCVVGLLGVGGILLGYGGKWGGAASEKRSRSPFYKLHLSRIVIGTNYTGPARGFIVSDAPIRVTPDPDPAVSRSPVAYLPPVKRIAGSSPALQATPLSSALRSALREIAIARIEQGGIPLLDEYMPDPENPSRKVPAPEEVLRSGNGSLQFLLDVYRDEEIRDAVTFSITAELWRQVYFSRDDSVGDLLKVLTVSAGPFRIRKQDLERAILYEFERLIQEQLVRRYQAANAKR